MLTRWCAKGFVEPAAGQPRIVRLLVSRRIAAPVDRVWGLLTDWPGQGAWMPATTVRVLPGPTEGPGTRLEAVTGFGPLRVVDPMEVVEWRPPVRCVTRHGGAVLRGTGTFEVHAVAGGCRVTWREDLETGPSFLARAGTAIAAWSARPFFAWALRRLDRVCTGRTVRSVR